MMKLTNLDHELAPIEKLPESVSLKYPTFKMLYRATLGNAIGKTPEESLMLFDLSNKLQGAGSELEISKEEFNLLAEKAARNTAQWVSHFHAQVLLQLKNDEGVSNGK
jgi:hypothetical protein